ncbi:MAG: hypothetical protein ACI9N9_000085 [Enterobacterales bacterium]|jgi:hypothetical protein
MKEIIEKLGFEELPMMTTFIDKLETYLYEKTKDYDDPDIVHNGMFNKEVNNYRDDITQPLTVETCELLIVSYSVFSITGDALLSELEGKYETIEQAINAGVKLKLK